MSVKLERVNRIDAGIDDIVVTPGGMNALYSGSPLLLEPGDEVLLPTPGFPNMDEMVRLLGGVPRFYRLLPADGFLPDFDELASLVTAQDQGAVRQLTRRTRPVGCTPRRSCARGSSSPTATTSG